MSDFLPWIQIENNIKTGDETISRLRFFYLTSHSGISPAPPAIEEGEAENLRDSRYPSNSSLRKGRRERQKNPNKRKKHSVLSS